MVAPLWPVAPVLERLLYPFLDGSTGGLLGAACPGVLLYPDCLTQLFVWVLVCTALRWPLICDATALEPPPLSASPASLPPPHLSLSLSASFRLPLCIPGWRCRTAGKLEDGTPFDSSYDRGSPFDLTLGAGMVIPGTFSCVIYLWFWSNDPAWATPGTLSVARWHGVHPPTSLSLSAYLQCADQLLFVLLRSAPAPALPSPPSPLRHSRFLFFFLVGVAPSPVLCLLFPGWEQGLQGMCAGEKRTLTIPYSLAYGEAGMGPIPPKATLVFDVEMMNIAGDGAGGASEDL